MSMSPFRTADAPQHVNKTRNPATIAGLSTPPRRSSLNDDVDTDYDLVRSGAEAGAATAQQTPRQCSTSATTTVTKSRIDCRMLPAVRNAVLRLMYVPRYTAATGIAFSVLVSAITFGRGNGEGTVQRAAGICRVDSPWGWIFLINATPSSSSTFVANLSLRHSGAVHLISMMIPFVSSETCAETVFECQDDRFGLREVFGAGRSR
jgi:hypothetical protein